MNSFSKPTVWVLIPNWNGLHHLELCLPSVEETCFEDFQVVIIDNASKDGSQEWVRRHFPKVRQMLFRENLGFTGACNAGIRAAMKSDVDYVVLLNNDTRVHQNWLSALVEVGERNPKVVLCTSQQKTWDGRSYLQFRYRPEWAEGEYELLDEIPYEEPKQEVFASGCSLLMRVSALKEIGLFDDRFFAGVEDIDLSLRAWIAGYQVFWVPSSIVYHRLGASSDTTLRAFWGYRNQLHTLLKNYELKTLSLFAHPILRRWFLTRNRVALRATLSVLLDIHTTIRLRSQIQRMRCRSDQEFLNI